ncbi:TetR/AcrR family transcriptional regulator [Novosphingobium gossypii]|uniref:TetR/AcrR family transcriptional regulator n=1 Tax=Novosphingobium gossypii TaxID=1604774 RepID=UPI003D19C7CC
MQDQGFTERNRRDIVAIATAHFAERGFAGARVDEIAAATATSKRMIYYHFGSKEGLYRAVLTEAYRGIRSAELGAGLDAMPALAALERLTALTFDYHFRHPELVRLVMDENMRQAPHVASVVEAHNATVLPSIQALIDRGVLEGTFRPGIEALDLHMTISALAFYYVSNRYTFATIFQADTTSDAAAARRREQVVAIVLSYCSSVTVPAV